MNAYAKIISLIFILNWFGIAQVPDAPTGFHWKTVDGLTDEFDGNTLNDEIWDNYHPNWSGRAPSAFKKGNCFVKDGFLNLKSGVQKDPSTVNDPFSDIWVDAAACATKEKLAKSGYYYEAKIKASNLSMTSSFWFRVGSYSEIDVIEHIGNPSRDNRDDDLPYQYHANTHYYGKYAGTDNLAAEWKMPTRGRDEFHTYGLWWKNPDTLWFYHNGDHVMTILPRYPLEENLKMIFDTEVFPFASAGVANIGLPLVENLNDDSKNTMYVDWVRVYELEAGDITKNINFMSSLNAYIINNNSLIINHNRDYTEIKIYSITGKVMLTKYLNKEQNSIQLNSLENGTYILKSGSTNIIFNLIR